MEMITIPKKSIEKVFKKNKDVFNEEELTMFKQIGLDL